jgi:ComF family protein
MRLLLEALYELLFPARCLGCEKQLVLHCPPLFCPACRAKILPFTPSCAAQDDFPFSAHSLCVYQEPVSSLLVRLKFNGDLSCLSSIAALVREAGAKRLPPEPDFILPVPLHRSRLRWRGFNQAILLAETCFPFWKDRIRVDLLQRHKKTVPQLHLTGEERRSNLRGAFSVRRPEDINGRRILLVDDVLTTGSTLRECANVLKESGAADIFAFAVARAVQDKSAA